MALRMEPHMEQGNTELHMEPDNTELTGMGKIVIGMSKPQNLVMHPLPIPKKLPKLLIVFS